MVKIFDRLAYQRDYRKKHNNLHTKVYEKTKSGKIMRTYRNMKSRIGGILKKKAHLYQGLVIINKDEFYEWSLADEGFNTLYEVWVASGYNRKLSPSIDRENPLEGYVIGNMRWITHSENSSLGARKKMANG
jgi:hypothetical protein